MRYNGKKQNARRSATQSEILALLSVSDQGPADFSRARILPRALEVQLKTTRIIQGRQKQGGLLRAAVTPPAAASGEHLVMGMTGAIISSSSCTLYLL